VIPTVFTTAFIYFSGHQRVIAAATVGCQYRLWLPTSGTHSGRLDHRSLFGHWLFLHQPSPGNFVAVVGPILVRVDKPNLSAYTRVPTISAWS